MQSFPVCLIHMSVSNGKNKMNKSVAIVGNSAISNIDIYSYWKDSMGNLYPLMLSSGCSANFKLLFRKRNFNG